MKKFVLLTLMLTMLSGCSYDSGRIQLFNYNLWGGPAPSSVVVQKGDTLYSISRRYDLPLREIIELNGLKPPYSLRIGQVVRLPSARYHVVAKGDTLYNISKRYNVNINSLSKANDLRPPYTLTVGQRLQLPDSIVGGETQIASVSQTSARKAQTSKKTTSKAASSSKTVKKKTTTTKTKVAKNTYTPPSKNRKSKFLWPVKGPVISNFGPIAKGRNNDGINIKAAKGTAVRAADKGTVAYAGNELKGFGNLILIKHDDGWVTAYAHNEKILVKKGQRVARGEKISTVGTTGGVASPQLHFEIRQGKKAVNPKSYLG